MSIIIIIGQKKFSNFLNPQGNKEQHYLNDCLPVKLCRRKKYGLKSMIMDRKYDSSCQSATQIVTTYIPVIVFNRN